MTFFLRGMRYMLSTLVFKVVPTIFEMSLVTGIMVSIVCVCSVCVCVHFITITSTTGIQLWHIICSTHCGTSYGVLWSHTGDNTMEDKVQGTDEQS